MPKTNKTEERSGRPFNPVTSFLQALGSLADASTLQGKGLKMWEDAMTGGFNRLANNDLFLNQVGRAMERSFLMKAHANQSMETALKAMRIPSAGELEEVHALSSQIDGKLDALGCQLEVLMERIEALDRRLEAIERGAAPAATKVKKAAAAKVGAGVGGGK